MSAQDLNDLDDATLVKELATQEYALVRGRFALSMSRLENTASLRGIRKDIARLKTEIRRREIDQGLPRNSLIAAHKVDAKELAEAGAGAGAGGFLAGVVDKLGE